MTLEGGLNAFHERDYARAFKHLRPLADDGDPTAQCTLGHMFYDPQVGWRKADHVESAKWFRRAAEQGNVEAQYLLGSMYSSNEGFESPGAMRRMAQRLKKTHAPNRDTEAYKWLCLAAKGGHTAADTLRKKLKKDLTPERLAEAKALLRHWRPAQEEAVALVDAKGRFNRKHLDRLG